MLGGNESGEDDEAASSNDVVVIPAPEGGPAELHHAYPSPIGAVLARGLFERDHTVRKALDLQIRIACAPIVEQEHRAIATGKKLLQTEDLSAVEAAGLAEKADLGERVEHHSRRLELHHLVEENAHRRLELDVLRCIERVVVESAILLGRRQLEERDAVE